MPTCVLRALFPVFLLACLLHSEIQALRSGDMNKSNSCVASGSSAVRREYKETAATMPVAAAPAVKMAVKVHMSKILVVRVHTTFRISHMLIEGL